MPGRQNNDTLWQETGTIDGGGGGGGGVRSKR